MDSEKYTFLKCPNCFEPILTRSTTTYDFEGIGWGVTVTILAMMQHIILTSILNTLMQKTY